MLGKRHHAECVNVAVIQLELNLQAELRLVSIFRRQIDSELALVDLGNNWDNDHARLEVYPPQRDGRNPDYRALLWAGIPITEVPNQGEASHEVTPIYRCCSGLAINSPYGKDTGIASFSEGLIRLSLIDS